MSPRRQLAIDCDAVIFDCDGVLVDSEYLCQKGLTMALAKLGISEETDELYRRYRGWQLQRIFTEIETRHGRSLGREFEEGYRDIVAALFERELQPVVGIRQLLDTLAVPFCVASNGPRSKIEHGLSLTGLLPYFQGHIYSAYEAQCWKPAPGLFLHAAEGLQVEPGRCLVVEDSEVGVTAAYAAGMAVTLYAPQGPTFSLPPEVTVLQDMRQLLSR